MYSIFDFLSLPRRHVRVSPVDLKRFLQGRRRSGRLARQRTRNVVSCENHSRYCTTRYRVPCSVRSVRRAAATDRRRVCGRPRDLSWFSRLIIMTRARWARSAREVRRSLLFPKIMGNSKNFRGYYTHIHHIHVVYKKYSVIDSLKFRDE